MRRERLKIADLQRIQQKKGGVGKAGPEVIE